MEAYKKIIDDITQALDNIENDINNYPKMNSKIVIEESLININRICINTKDLFKIIHLENDAILSKEEKAYQYYIFDRLSDCIVRCAYLKSLLFMLT